MTRTEQLFEAKRLLILYKIQLKIHQAYNKIYLLKIQNIIRDINLGKDMSNAIIELKSKIFGIENQNNKEEDNGK